MIKKILTRILIISIFYIVFVLFAPDIAFKMDEKLKININHKIINIKDKLIFAFSNEDNLKKSLDSVADNLDSKTKKVTEKLDNPAPNITKKLKKEQNL
jgi:ribosome-associated translation inhibitor RaiA